MQRPPHLLLERTNLQVHATADRVYTLQGVLAPQCLSHAARNVLAAEDTKPREFMQFMLPNGTLVMEEIIHTLPRDDESSGEGMDDNDLYADVLQHK